MATTVLDERSGSEPERGEIVAVHGDVIEVAFAGRLPNIHEALTVRKADGSLLVLEVHDHASPTVVKAIALGSTQGLQRDLPVEATARSVLVPVGAGNLGGVFNLFGERLGARRSRPPRSGNRSTWRPPPSASRSPRRDSLNPGSRSSTCSPHSRAAGKIGRSAGRASARPCCSWNSSTRSPRSTPGSRCSAESASACARGTNSGRRWSRRRSSSARSWSSGRCANPPACASGCPSPRSPWRRTRATPSARTCSS